MQFFLSSHRFNKLILEFSKTLEKILVQISYKSVTNALCKKYDQHVMKKTNLPNLTKLRWQETQKLIQTKHL